MFKNKTSIYSNIISKSFTNKTNTNLTTMTEINKSKNLNIKKFMPALNTRWSPRAFSDKPVNEEDLKILFEAARWAPSCFNEQPWSFIVGSRSSSPKAYDLIFDSLVVPNQLWAKTAPVLIVSLSKSNFAMTGQPNVHADYDVGQAVGFFILQADHLGLYSHQMGGFSPEIVIKNFNIPKDFKPISVMALGYIGELDRLPKDYASKEGLPRARKEQKSFVFGEKWGESRI